MSGKQTGLIYATLPLGTRFAGVVMDKFKKEEKFQWRQIFMVPAGVALVCILVFVLLFKARTS